MRTERGVRHDESRYEAAEKRAEDLQGLYTHLLVYGVVNLGLFVINLLTKGDGGTWWFYWPLAGWGIGLAIHVLVTFGGVFSDDWKERKAPDLRADAQAREVAHRSHPA